MVAHASLRWTSRILLVVLLLAMLLPPLAASAETPAFRGEYYNNTSLSGSPSLVRYDANISFDWGSGSPAAEIGADNFTVRWTNFVSFAAGTYRFSARSDDGMRVWIDDTLVLDRWIVQPATTLTVDRTLGAGFHSLKVEYLEVTSQAVAQFWWDKIADGGAYPQWKGEYFGNVSLSGSPAVTRNDADINFNWGYNSPDAAIGADNFSARWTRVINLSAAGTYTFNAAADDGVRVKVDGTTIIDSWIDSSVAVRTANVSLAAGDHTVIAEYYERTGTAQMQLTWSLSSSSGPTSVVIVVDDQSGGFTRGGSLSGFHGVNQGYASHLFWVWNDATSAYFWGRWTPSLPAAGYYDVQVYIPSHYFGTVNARYRVIHNGGRDDRVIAQAHYYDQWVSLGSYYFSAAGGEYVFLASNTGEPYATRYVGFDAVRFIGTASSGSTTPTPTPVPSTPVPSCAIMPVLGFAQLWNANTALRNCLQCPAEAEKSVWMAQEAFEGGRMLWRSDNDQIYVFYNDGTWRQYANLWHSGDPETDPSITPPAGKYQPRRGFGKLWRDNAEVKSKLGWATNEESGEFGTVQTFQGGLMMWTSQNGVVGLCNDGRWVKP